MASENQMNENGVSGPLKHLLSIDWENAVNISPETDNNKTNNNQLQILKQCKKVRFADELEHLKSIDLDEEEDRLTNQTEYNEYEMFLRKNDGMISENSMHCIDEDERTSSPTETLQTLFNQDEESDDQIITKDHDQFANLIPVSGICENTNNDFNSVKQEQLIEVSQTVFHSQDAEYPKESDATCKQKILNYSDSNNSDAEFKNWKVLDGNEHPQLWKMALNMSTVKRQSSKINSLLEKRNAACYCAADFQKAIFQAWCEVKSEQKMRRKEKSPPTAHTNDEKEEKTAIANAYLRWKKSKRVKKNSTGKMDLDSSPDPATETDKNESEVIFKMWKKKKDAILLKRKAEGSRLEHEENVNLLMNAELRKEEAELAYAAWKYHKYELVKKEKHKQDWMLLKEKEKLLMQSRRNDEALIVYLKWLEKKKYLETSINQELTLHKDPKQKAPWYPPNKI